PPVDAHEAGARRRRLECAYRSTDTERVAPRRRRGLEAVMTTKNNSTWQKPFVEIIDQRQRELPPTWASTQATAAARAERGRAVFESGRGREMANAVVSLLAQAREKVVLSSFLLADKGVE